MKSRKHLKEIIIIHVTIRLLLHNSFYHQEHLKGLMRNLHSKDLQINFYQLV